MGIRVLDVRVKFASKNYYRSMHRCFDCLDLLEILTQIKRFVKKSGDVIFVDFHEVQCVFWDDAQFYDFYLLVTGFLDEYIIQDATVSTLNQAKATGKKIMVDFRTTVSNIQSSVEKCFST